MKNSKDYIKGFKQGVKWAITLNYTYNKLILISDLKQAIKSIKTEK